MPVRPELLEILVCPACRSELNDQGDSLVCTNGDCRLCYAVRDDIPVMLIDEADELDLDTWRVKTSLE
jgi:uncharacterized protein YbaR (Trm112 family)